MQVGGMALPAPCDVCTQAGASDVVCSMANAAVRVWKNPGLDVEFTVQTSDEHPVTLYVCRVTLYVCRARHYVRALKRLNTSIISKPRWRCRKQYSDVFERDD